MTLSEIKLHLETVHEVRFSLSNGTSVPAHFHVTEIGLMTKQSIDCGGTVRRDAWVSFQLWAADDLDHRLKPAKLRNIIALSERTLALDDLRIEVEYQSDTIGAYELGFANGTFLLLPKQTTCLASDACGVTPAVAANACTNGAGCC